MFFFCLVNLHTYNEKKNSIKQVKELHFNYSIDPFCLLIIAKLTSSIFLEICISQ